MSDARTVAPEEIDEERAADVALRPSRLDEFVGQSAVHEQVRILLEAGALGGPLHARFGVTFRLDFYAVDELVAIANRSARLLEVELDAAGAQLIASRARGTPRIVNRLLRRSRDYAQVRAAGHIDAAV